MVLALAFESRHQRLADSPWGSRGLMALVAQSLIDFEDPPPYGCLPHQFLKNCVPDFFVEGSTIRPMIQIGWIYEEVGIPIEEGLPSDVQGSFRNLYNDEALVYPSHLHVLPGPSMLPIEDNIG